MIEIRNIGDTLPVSKNGHIIKKACHDLIPIHWRPLINDLVGFYRYEVGDNLVGVYVRGSVATGNAVDYLSDLDSFFISKTPFKLDPSAGTEFQRLAGKRYPFCKGIELLGTSVQNLHQLHPPKSRNFWQELIKTQSASVWGEDLSDQIPPFELKDMFNHSYLIQKEINKLTEDLQTKSETDNVSQDCVWIMKRLVRTGFELVMLRENRWTRDLYPCLESFCHYYPEKRTLMTKAVSAVLNPIKSAKELAGLIEEFKPWIFDEIKRQVPQSQGTA
jgi:hypothetical protein